MDNLARKVSELRKRVEESRRRLCAKKDEMNQLDQAVEKKENEVRRLHSAMASLGGRGLSPRASGNQPVNFYRAGGNNHHEAAPLFQVSSRHLPEVSILGLESPLAKGARGGAGWTPTSPSHSSASFPYSIFSVS